MTAHEDPDHGIGHCHHPFPTRGCDPCWNALPNTEFRARLNREEYAELAEYGEQVRRWARDRRIDNIPAAFDRLRDQSSAKEQEQATRIRELEAEVQRLGDLLRDAIARLPRKKQG